MLVFILLWSCTESDEKTTRPNADLSSVDTAQSTNTTTPTTTTTTTDPEPYTLGALTFEDGRVPSNLLMVSLDTTRRDYIGRFAGTTTTPNLDAFLEEAVVLENHNSCSNWTGPSMTCVASGRTPMGHGFWPAAWLDPQVELFPSADYAPLSTRLSDSGWATGLVTANRIFGNGGKIHGAFDRYREVAWLNGDVVANAALEQIDRLRDDAQRWYHHSHFFDPHQPYCPPDGFIDEAALGTFPVETLCNMGIYEATDGFADLSSEEREELLKTANEAYRAELESWDTHFGHLLQELDVRGDLDDTLVVFVTDHGEQFGEHGAFGHGQVLRAQEYRSTAAFWSKNLVPGTWTQRTVHQDLAATLYALYGFDTSDLDGVPLGTASADRAVFAMNYWGNEVELAVFKHDKQLQYHWSGERYFYDLAEDPGTTSDMYDPLDLDVVDLWTDMSALISEVEAAWPHLDPPANPGP